MKLNVHNPHVARLIRPIYSTQQLRELLGLLLDRRTLSFNPLPDALYPASASDDAGVTGYKYVWVRDNVMVAYAHFLNGAIIPAASTVDALSSYFLKHRDRFTAIIQGVASPSDPMQRPHVRFDAETLNEIPQRWAHAQNDALGYYLWLTALMIVNGIRDLEAPAANLAGLFVEYFRAIRFWQDEDSGHWEEARKIEASSIGVVTASLIALRSALSANSRFYQLSKSYRAIDPAHLDELIGRGEGALASILPHECIQDDPGKRRDCDSALLFLVYPTEIVLDGMADRIIEQVVTSLFGDYGISRYRGDSYWCADYKRLLRVEERTQNFSENMEKRDALLRRGEEAQWCIFDPILSSIYGRRFRISGRREDLEEQFFFLNRSLGQITPDFLCPEAYYLESGKYVPNDNTPLLWTQANLWTAMHHAIESLTRKS